MKDKLLLLLIMLMAFGALGNGCSWMGRTAGKAQAKLERKSDEMESGYEEGYRKEKAKSSGGKSSSGGQAEY